MSGSTLRNSQFSVPPLDRLPLGPAYVAYSRYDGTLGASVLVLHRARRGQVKAHSGTGSRSQRKKAQQQRATEYLVRPFITERGYRIVVPEGFVPRALREDQTVQLGTATLTRHFALEKNVECPKLVTDVYRFDTVKQRYSTDEVLALRKAAGGNHQVLAT